MEYHKKSGDHIQCDVLMEDFKNAIFDCCLILFEFTGYKFMWNYNRKDAANVQDQGCEGGLIDNAFQLIQKNHGLSTEAYYPYNGTDGTYNAKMEPSIAAKIIGYEDVPANSEKGPS
ncbi:hypothetical protein L3X38_017475 [Prunus dulcis]|uniref:Peptidase C1A papain C-terminal domain-containing protein n=1 Tax=Prunus dulcis TaxID=3755 RepID=A0AAD4W7C6_PRUDU|nr:hypothetical protein L3X38_017475 [Prunus dulcis]